MTCRGVPNKRRNAARIESDAIIFVWSQGRVHRRHSRPIVPVGAYQHSFLGWGMDNSLDGIWRQPFARETGLQASTARLIRISMCAMPSRLFEGFHHKDCSMVHGQKRSPRVLCTSLTGGHKLTLRHSHPEKARLVVGPHTLSRRRSLSKWHALFSLRLPQHFSLLGFGPGIEENLMCCEPFPWTAWRRKTMMRLLENAPARSHRVDEPLAPHHPYSSLFPRPPPFPRHCQFRNVTRDGPE